MIIRIAALLALTSLLLAQTNPVLKKVRRAATKAPLVVAHRGASSTHPENTLVALRAALDAGADVVEFDIYQTKDGRWVCFHDTTVDRTTDGETRLGRKGAKIADLTFAEVRALDAGSWFDEEFAGERVPTLAEALDVILPEAVPMVERKGGAAGALAEELRRLRVVNKVLVQSFDWQFLEALHAAEPRVLIGALGSRPLTVDRFASLARTGASVVHWSAQDLSIEAVASVRTAGQLLCVYTVNPDIGMLGAAAMGCDLITTDRPARMVELRRRGLMPRGPRKR